MKFELRVLYFRAYENQFADHDAGNEMVNVYSQMLRKSMFTIASCNILMMLLRNTCLQTQSCLLTCRCLRRLKVQNLRVSGPLFLQNYLGMVKLCSPDI